MDLQLNIAICDDETYYRNHIEALVREYLQGEDVLFRIELFEDGRNFCEEPENVRKFDVIFLDIEMRDMNGMETAYFIRKRNSEMDIVFITVASDYVFEGYRVNAVRYIMKNNLKELLPECLADILKRRRYRGHKMEFSFVGGKRTVFLDDILYIESQSHKLQFKIRDGSLSMYGRVDELESKLQEYLFLRCHQSFLVNMGHIEKIRNYQAYLSDGSEVPVARSRYPEVKRDFLRYKGI